jgi:hypothetical protein
MTDHASFYGFKLSRDHRLYKWRRISAPNMFDVRKTPNASMATSPRMVGMLVGRPKMGGKLGSHNRFSALAVAMQCRWGRALINQFVALDRTVMDEMQIAD